MSLEDHLYPLLRIYGRSPRWMRSLAGRTYRQLPETVRFGARYGEQIIGALQFQRIESVLGKG